MGKAPADQFYYKDWKADVELQMASASTRGVWIDLLATMWFAEPKGTLTAPREKMAQFGNCTLDELGLFLDEAERYGFCDIVTGSNGNVTVTNRRMHREAKTKESNRLRQERFRKKDGSNTGSNAKVTPLSPTPTPNSKGNPPQNRGFKQHKNEDGRANWRSWKCPRCNNLTPHLYDNGKHCYACMTRDAT